MSATAAARRRVALALVAATVPVILTGLGQLWWGWHGPFQALGGLVIWHIKAGGNPPGRLAGLFDYANIAGSWLALAWPFALAALLQRPLRPGMRGIALLIASGLACDHLEVSGDGRHWSAVVVSAAFEGKRLIGRHQLVYATLGARIKTDEVHALSMKTFTPAEWAAQAQ